MSARGCENALVLAIKDKYRGSHFTGRIATDTKNKLLKEYIREQCAIIGVKVGNGSLANRMMPGS